MLNRANSSSTTSGGVDGAFCSGGGTEANSPLELFSLLKLPVAVPFTRHEESAQKLLGLLLFAICSCRKWLSLGSSVANVYES